MKSYLEWVPGRWKLSRTEMELEEISQAGLSSPTFMFLCSLFSFSTQDIDLV